MANVFFDCGGHFGEGLQMFKDKYAMDSTWQVYSFEPNKESYKKLSEIKISAPTVFINKAVWLYDGKITFNAEYPPEKSTADGAGSSLIPLEYWKPKSENNPGAGDIFDSYEVECVDFSKFILENSVEGDNVIVKFDIEGAEFDLLRKMIQDNSILRIKTLYIEFHDFCYSKESYHSKEILISKLKSLGIEVHGHV